MQKKISYRQLEKENKQLKSTILSYQRSSQQLQATIFILAVQLKTADPENEFVTEKHFDEKFISAVDADIERRKKAAAEKLPEGENPAENPAEKNG